ncbi:hypothetical protein PoB_004039600 [Plakobranchus ocellatus]|uniref:Uncharacterized protein n=1 Tax=Plakobranchus ocellatus TaxID=259542 RepID=A0AAV4B505_9GAST|nr:hypothetical protein PoB_004039600 [Plakobranchus ocellatus]
MGSSPRQHPKAAGYATDRTRENSYLENKSPCTKLPNHGLMYHRSSFSTLSIYDIKRFLPEEQPAIRREFSELNTISKSYNTDFSAMNSNDKQESIMETSGETNTVDKYSNDKNSDQCVGDTENNTSNHKTGKRAINDKTFIISHAHPSGNTDESSMSIEQRALPAAASRPKLRKKSKSTLTPKLSNQSKANSKTKDVHPGRKSVISSQNHASSNSEKTNATATNHVTSTTATSKTTAMQTTTPTTTNDYNHGGSTETGSSYDLKLKIAHEALTPRRVKNGPNAKKKNINSNENTPRQLKKAKILKRTSALLKTLESSPYLQGPIRRTSDLSLAKIKKP